MAAQGRAIYDRRMDTRLPIVFVRGWAGGLSGIDNAVNDPFYGFNNGSTHVWNLQDEDDRYYQFGGPMLGLIQDHKYQLLVNGNQDAYLKGRSEVAANTIWVCRFYDSDASTFGKPPKSFGIPEAADYLARFITRIYEVTGKAGVLVVTHSMGGLVVRAMMASHPAAGRAVRRLFTYAAPHGGIEFELGAAEVAKIAMEWIDVFGSEIFTRRDMRKYLLTKSERAEQPYKSYNPTDWVAREGMIGAEDVCCLIGTDARDFGLPRLVVGPASDGLVQIRNAQLTGSPRTFVHRSHTGARGELCSAEGYENMRRFLFGRYRADVGLTGVTGGDDNLYVEVRVVIRGLDLIMNEQTIAHHCPVVIKPRLGAASPARVELATVFLLDPAGTDTTSPDLRPAAAEPAGDRRNSPTGQARYGISLQVRRKNWLGLNHAPLWSGNLLVEIGESAVTGQWIPWLYREDLNNEADLQGVSRDGNMFPLQDAGVPLPPELQSAALQITVSDRSNGGQSQPPGAEMAAAPVPSPAVAAPDPR
jgi:pimeloyl-ACP methyl ester carboxylesterase